MTVSTAQDLRPLPGKSIIDDYTIRHEPRGTLGRFFLRADQLFLNAGIRLRSIGPAELVRINEANREHWLPLISTMDHREFPMAGDEFLAIAGYDDTGEAVATIGSRQFDMHGTTLRQEAESLRLYYGERAAEMRSQIHLSMTAPIGDRMTGTVSYMGALWVHPKARKLGLTRLLHKHMRYFTYAQSKFDYDVAFSVNDISAPHVHVGYASEGLERGYSYAVEGAYAYSGWLTWVSRDFMLNTLAADVEEMERVSNLREIVGGQNVPRAAASER